MPNLQKWVNLSFLACGVVAWLLFREIFAPLFNALALQKPDWFVTPPDVAGVACGFIAFIILLRSVKANTFLTEVLAELAKVTWPVRKETVLSTGVVAIMVGIASLCILSFDSIWAWIVEHLLYR